MSHSGDDCRAPLYEAKLVGMAGLAAGYPAMHASFWFEVRNDVRNCLKAGDVNKVVWWALIPAYPVKLPDARFPLATGFLHIIRSSMQ